VSVKAACWFWKKNSCSYFADKDDILAVSRIVNMGNAYAKGTPNGLDDRKNILTRAKEVLKELDNKRR